MSTIPPYYSPEGSNDLFNSETGELIFSAKKTIWKDSTFECVKEEIYKEIDYKHLSNQRKLHNIVNAFISSGREIKINTPPPPSASFLPRVYNLQKLALQDQELFDSENSLSLF
jgi:hypothetical protein